jgi:hypothetical protein
VVADEVKQLAQETAKATEDIARRVLATQGDRQQHHGRLHRCRVHHPGRTAVDELSRMTSDLRSTVSAVRVLTR